MTAKQLKRKYLNFFLKKGHKKLPNVSLVPENDPTALFINSGMHPLVPYLLGEAHPLGTRLTSNQKCVRTGDIEEVGDTYHHTFFEMLGNWSLGDYWKEEALVWSLEFLTKEINLKPERIYITCFAGDENAPKDEEAAKIWRSLGIPRSRVSFLGEEFGNWWSVGKTGPCGPCSEMYYDTGKEPCSSKCQPGCDCDKYIEIWNDVFMEFNRKPDGHLEKLKQRNIDTGMGVERTTAVLQGTGDNYLTELFQPIVQKIEELSKKKYEDEKNRRPMRIIADHLRAATFMMADGVIPSNVERGYILRRLIRQAIVGGRGLGIEKEFTVEIAKRVVTDYQDEYPHLKKNQKEIKKNLVAEEERFAKVISSKKLERIRNQYQQIAGRNLGPAERAIGTAKVAFNSCTTYGLPLEICLEEARKVGLIVTSEDKEEVEEAFAKKMGQHRQKSRASLDKKFAGGLADHSEVVTKLHTATHLLHQALRDVLGDHVKQVGSNITPERLRFDFTHPKKLTAKELARVEEIINEKIKADLSVRMEMVSLEEAKKRGAMALFGDKYGDKVKLYCVGDYSKEVCAGPHVGSTGKIKGVKIIKEKSVSAGRRRIYARLAESAN